MNMIIKPYITKAVVSLVSLITFNVNAASYSVATLAQQDVNNPKHVKMLVALADSGNISAQYNLAKRYSTGKGVEQNQNLAKNWLQDATRSGMIQAYLRMNSKAIAPANGMRLVLNETPVQWLRNQQPGMYTIQIASSRSEDLMKKYYETNNLAKVPGDFHYVKSTNNGYAMIHGSFKTVAAAKTALSKLPSELTQQSPWIRKIKSFQDVNL